MIAATIIVLREMLEICLIIGMISAALKDFTYKNRALLIGVISGVIISIILSLSLRQINRSFDGNGQEIMNIIILSASILCITWTLIWINRHGKNLYEKITDAYQKLQQDDADIWPIILIITLSISREGAELILFLAGVSTHVDNSYDIIYGALLGAAIGIILGLIIYKGLLRASTKYFFKAINFMLIILAAGMSAHLALYLDSIDLISGYSRVLWDSSWLIDESSLSGKLLNGTIGYSSHPTALQVMFYTITFIGLYYIVSRKRG